MDDLLFIEEAKKRILDSISMVEATQTMPLADTWGRVIAVDIISDQKLPSFTNSSMDGFAVCAEDTRHASRTNPITLDVIADIPAGIPPNMRIANGQAARIMTGAPLPFGADAVVQVEHTDQFHPSSDCRCKVEMSLSSDLTLPTKVKIYRGIETGENIREAGEDCSIGERLITRGHRLRAQDLGLLRLLGIDVVTVYKRPVAALLATGNELMPAGVPLEQGTIRESNSTMLAPLIRKNGCDVHLLGIACDDKKAIRDHLDKAVDNGANLIITTAGVSVGSYDFVRDVVLQHGEINFWKVNMRPGKPLAFGKYKGTPFLGLPGNPVSAYIGFSVFVEPMLRKLAGLPLDQRRVIQVKLKERVTSDGRESFLRAFIEYTNEGNFARLTGHQGSGNLLSLVRANALLRIPSGTKELAEGDQVDAWVLDA